MSFALLTLLITVVAVVEVTLPWIGAGTNLSGSLVNHPSHSVLELIIEEQVEKLQVTLRGIETLSVVARDTASKLTELIGAEEVHVCMYVCVCGGGGGVQVCIYLHVVCQRVHIELGKH